MVRRIVCSAASVLAAAAIAGAQPVPSLLGADSSADVTAQAVVDPDLQANNSAPGTGAAAVFVDLPYPGLFAGDSDASSGDGAAAGDNSVSLLNGGSGSVQVNPVQITANNMRIAVGGDLDANDIGTGSYFGGFDVRPGPNGQVNGYQSPQAFTQASVNAATGQASAGSSTSLKTRVIKSDADMTSALSVAVSLNGAYLGDVATVQNQFGYSQSSSSESHRVSGWTFGRQAIPGLLLQNTGALNLTDTAEALLTADVDAFFNTYGTHFVKTKVYGCQATALYTFSCQSQKAAQDISDALSANYNGGAFSVGGSVNVTYSTYSSSQTCTYDGSFQATGLGDATISPSSTQMMNATLMDAFWNGFGAQCKQAGTEGASSLLFIELGNWLEVPAVSAAVAGNQTAMGILNFYSTFVPQDLNALSVGGLYQYSVGNAVQNYETESSEGVDLSKPFATTGLFDRSGQATGAADLTQYFAGLANAHAAVAQRQATTIFTTYFNPQTVAQAIASKQTASSLVRQYWADVSALYRDAVAAYQWAYSGVSVWGVSFNAQNSPVSQSTRASANAVCNNPSPPELNYPPALCAPYATIPIGDKSTYFGVSSGVSSPNADIEFLFDVLSVIPNDSGLIQVAGSVVNGQTFGSIDITNTVPNNADQLPVRLDLTVEYIMPDITLRANPYSA